MPYKDRDAESFFAGANDSQKQDKSSNDERPCARCGMEPSRHVRGQCGRYLWPHSNEQHRGRIEPDDPRRVYDINLPESKAPPAEGPADLARMPVAELASVLKALREREPAPAGERDEERSRAIARQQVAESRASWGCVR